MKATEDLLRREFIGLNATVFAPGIRSPVRGRIFDETRNMMKLEKAGKEWSIPKAGSRILLEVGGHRVEVLGDWIVGTPADRMKKKFRRLET